MPMSPFQSRFLPTILWGIDQPKMQSKLPEVATKQRLSASRSDRPGVQTFPFELLGDTVVLNLLSSQDLSDVR
jgi:hypothetical protein